MTGFAMIKSAAIRFKGRLWASGPSEFLEDSKNSGTSSQASGYGQEKAYEEEPEVKLVTFRFITCFCVLFSALGLAALDYSATGNVMAQIGRDLKGSTSEVEWIGNGYSLTACVLQLPISALSDIFGRRALLMVSLALFFIGSLLSGTAQNMSAMIAGRAIQGAGGGGCLVLPEIVVSDTIPLRQRSLVYGIFLFIWAVFSGSAPLIAGALAEYASWRWFFYMNLFISGAGIIAAPYGIKLKAQNGNERPWWVKIREIDYIGAVLLIGSGVCILLSLSRGGSSAQLPWSHWSIIFPLALGGAGFVVTSIYEYWRKPAVPMFNIRVFSNLSSSLCLLQNVLQGVVNLCTIYYLPTFFQGVKNLDSVESGAAILPLNLVGPPFVILFGYFIDRTGHYHWVNLLMWALATAGVGIMTLYSGKYSLGALISMQLMASIGINALYATLSTTVNATNPPALWTESTAMMSFFRSCGDTLGTAIGGAVLASQLRTRLGNLASSGINVPDSMNVLTIADFMKHVDSPEVKDALIDVLSKSIQVLFIVLTVFCGVGFGTTLLQKEYSLDQHAESKQGIDN